MSMPRIDPRLRVLYLLGLAVGIFFIKSLWILALVAGAQGILWLAVGLLARGLVRNIVKLWPIAAFFLASYALTSEDPSVDRWQTFTAFGHSFSLNIGGVLIGAAMVLRMITVILASHVVRAGDPQAIATGFRKLHMPRVAAASIDAVLVLIAGSGMGRGGRGDGSGGGRGGGGGGRGGGGGQGRDPHQAPGGFWAALKSLAKGDIGFLAARLDRQIDRAEQHVEYGETPSAIASDVATIAGISATMLGIKALKILPNIPFAPGHKLVLLTPLYVVASLYTKSRFGATWTGFTMGVVAFLLGDGKYGVFEVAKHVVPGLLCDLLVPRIAKRTLLAQSSEQTPDNKLNSTKGAWIWSLVGGFIAAGRFATIFSVTLFVQAPAVAWAFLVPGASVHITFGVLSGYVSHHLVRAVAQRPRGKLLLLMEQIRAHQNQDHPINSVRKEAL
ncbi:MAG: hypothetical protein IPK82_09155 [Polyangiaceae bacterium]|nr:hypothetical protein [Polyangiaceae bacterium]